MKGGAISTRRGRPDRSEAIRAGRGRRMWVRAILIGVLGGALAGCAHQVVRPADPVLTGIHRAADRIALALTRLSRMKQASIHHVQSYPIPRGALATPIQMNWSGRLLPAVRAVAALVGHGWTVRRVGRPPVAPLIVSVHVQKTPAYEVLESLGWQAGRQAGVVVNLQARLIEVITIGGGDAS